MRCTSFTNKLLMKSVQLIVSVALFLTFASCFAGGQDVALVYQQDKSFAVTIASHIAKKLGNSNISTSLITLQSLQDLGTQQIESSTLIVGLGSETTYELLKKDISTPILSLLIPKQSYDTMLKNKNGENQWSVLFIDQPISRQLLLIKHLLGPDKTIGTLLGPYSISEKQDLTRLAGSHGQQLQIQEIQITDQLISSLKTLSHNSDVVLALPDPVAFNKQTIRGILLLTYRENIPLIGFSRSYVKAGAIASLFSELDQISNQAYEMIEQFLVSGKFEEQIYYPEYFSIAINRKVARTLNISLQDEDTLISLIKNDERNQ